MKYPSVVSVLLFAAALNSGQAAITIADFSTLINDRYSNDASFVADGYDLSGVSIADTSASRGGWDDGGRWLSMVSRNVFLSVNHASFFPANGESVTFYASNDTAGASTTRTILDSERIDSSDIRIGLLDAPLPTSYATYDYAATAFDLETAVENGELVDDPLAPYYGQNAFLFGRSPTNWATRHDIAVGRNILDRWYIDFEGDHDAIAAIEDAPGDPNFSSSEAYLRVGDSGGPLMVDNGSGNLTIVGLNWFNGTLEGSSRGSGFSYVGNYSTEIDDYIAANPVPEAKQISWLLGIAFAFAFFRRRAINP